MKVFTRMFFLAVALCCWGIVGYGQTILIDDFNRVNNNTVGNGWTESETTATGARISSNRLQLGSTTSGREWVYKDASSNYTTNGLTDNTTVLTWAFNFQNTRSDPSGFDSGNYGLGFILGSTSASISTGVGYAVVIGNSGSTDPIRLTRFSSGISSNSSFTNIISGGDFGSAYISVRVTYNPTNDEWQLFVESAGSAFPQSDPRNTSTQIGSNTINTTYTSSGNNLRYFGALWNHATSATDNAVFDDIYFPLITACTAPTTKATNFSASGITSTSMDVNWDDGNGDRVLVIAKEGSAVNTDPVSGTAYTANASFGSGSELGTGNFVIYDGAGTSPGSSSVSVTGLNPGSTYYYAIYSYNDVDDCYNTDELTGNAATVGPDIQLQYPIGTDVACGSLTINFGGEVAGSGTNSLTFRIENTGDGDLTLTLPLTVGGTNASDYSITTQPSAIIGAGLFSDVIVEFAPSATGTRTASIAIISDDPNESPCNVNLTGLGTVENDECTDATPLSVNADESCTLSTSGTTVGASDSGVGTICGGNANDDVWYSFVATATTHSVLVTVGTGFDAVLDVRSGACDGTNIACADAFFSGGDEEAIVSGLSIGATYYIRIYSYVTTAGTFDVCVNTPPPPANPGDVVINEFMPDPSCGSDASAEYVELYNTTSSTIDINGWTLSDNTSDSHTFSNSNGTTIIPAGGYLLCAISQNNTYFGFTIGYDYSSFTLANGDDEIILKEGSTEICRVNYSDGNLFGAGVSLQLPEDYDYSLADDGTIDESEYEAPNTPFGCGDFGTPNAANILPVNLLTFTAKALNNQTHLSFTTATEENNSHFLIQRSTDEGKTFATIGQVDGKGDSHSAVDYEFVDTKPAAGMNYYRLQQFDFDGTNEFFGPVAVRFSGEVTDAPVIWPVPARDRLQIELPASDSDWLLEVFDLNGRRLLQQTTEEKGLNTFFDLNTLPAGSYFLRWNNGSRSGQERFLKV